MILTVCSKKIVFERAAGADQFTSYGRVWPALPAPARPSGSPGAAAAPGAPPAAAAAPAPKTEAKKD